MPMAAIGDIAKVFNGKTPAKSEQREAGYPVLKIRDVDALGNIRGDFGSFVDVELAEKFRVKHLCEGDTLILNAAHNSDYVASKTFYASQNHLGPLITGEWTVVRPDSALVDPRYVRRYIESPGAKRLIKEMVNGIHLYPKDVARCPIPLPPLPEQRRIAAILDKADALRAKRREAIAKLDQLLQSVFLEMFGDPVTNPKGWPLISFADVGQWKSGATPSKSEPAYWDGSFPWVSPKDMKVSLITDAQDHVSDLAFESTNLKRIEPGHLLIVVRGMILAHSFPTAVNAVSIAINQDMKAIAPIKDLNIVYLQAAVDSLKGRILSVVSTAGHGTCRLDTRDASEVMVPIPPLEVQLAYKAVASKYTQLRVDALEQLKKLDSMFGAIQQKAFVGAL